MRTGVLLWTFAAGCSSPSVSPSPTPAPDPGIGGTTVPTATSSALVRETFPSARDAADVLLVVDNSCSMADEQEAIFENADLVLDTPFSSDVDYRVGVVTTDLDNPDDQGKLREIDGARWIDPSHPDPLGALAALVQVGVMGGGLERGLGASYLALEFEGNGANEGFLRDEAQLAVIVISDEPDFTQPALVTEDEWLDWFLQLEPDPLDVSFHGAVHRKRGDAYLAVIDALGGARLDLSVPHTRARWDEFFTAALGGVHARAGVALAGVPDPDTIVAGTTVAGIDLVLDPADYTYEPATNRVRFARGAVAPGLPVWVEYEPL